MYKPGLSSFIDDGGLGFTHGIIDVPHGQDGNQKRHDKGDIADKIGFWILYPCIQQVRNVSETVKVVLTCLRLFQDHANVDSDELLRQG